MYYVVRALVSRVLAASDGTNGGNRNVDLDVRGLRERRKPFECAVSG